MTTGPGTVETVFWGILTFSILVVLHEMGHFLAARAFGVKVHEFMIGLPGPALRLHTKRMAWGVTAIPLGGYVRIAGMEPGDEDELLGEALVAIRDADRLDAAGLARVLSVSRERAEAIVTSLLDWKAIEELDDGSLRLTVDGGVDGLTSRTLADLARSVTYRGKKTWQRVTILAMGVVVNLLVAILTFTVVLSVFGYFEYTTTLSAVEPETPAAMAGLRDGDTLVSIEGTTLEGWDDVQLALLATSPGDRVTIVAERDGERMDFTAVLGDKEGHGFLGVLPEAIPVQPSLLESAGESFRLVGLVFGTIVDLFRPSTFATTVRGVRSVVGVSVMAAEAARAGALAYAGLVAMLSLSLGVMNILPIPPLDGGKVALEIIERVLGRPLNRTVTLAVSAVGAVLLFSLIGYIMYADIVRIAQ